MTRTFLLLAAAGLLGACAQSGTSTASRSSGGQYVSITPELRAEIERQGLDPDEEICRKVEDTGSTIPRRVCATRVAWEAQSQAARQGTDEAQRAALRAVPPGN